MGAAGLAVDSDGGNRSSAAMLERNEDVLRKDPRTSLTLLAKHTGGFLVENTNDLADAFSRVDSTALLLSADLRADERALDGAWRNVVGQVPTPGHDSLAIGYLAKADSATRHADLRDSAGGTRAHSATSHAAVLGSVQFPAVPKRASRARIDRRCQLESARGDWFGRIQRRREHPHARAPRSQGQATSA